MITEPGTSARLLYTFINDNGIIELENVLQQKNAKWHLIITSQQKQNYIHNQIDIQCGVK